MPQMGPHLWLGVHLAVGLMLVSMLSTMMCTPCMASPPTPPGSYSLPWLW